MTGAQQGRGVLGARLVAAACCLLAAGAAIVVLATGMLAHGYLMGQADRQLRAYARMLASGPFTVMPDYPGPGAGAGLLTEVTSRGGQLVLRTGPGRPPGPAAARIPRRAGQLATVPASSGGGSWLVIAVPVHYQARHIAYTYGSSGFSLLVSGTARPGLAWHAHHRAGPGPRRPGRPQAHPHQCRGERRPARWPSPRRAWR